MNKKKSSKELTSEAARVLKNKNTSKIQKKLAASVLSQRKKQKQTGAELEDIASKVLKSEKYSETTKSLAGSVLSQANKER